MKYTFFTHISSDQLRTVLTGVEINILISDNKIFMHSNKYFSVEKTYLFETFPSETVHDAHQWF